MFIYTIFPVISRETYFYGLTLQLNHFMQSNPEWSYRLMTPEQASAKIPHLIILDFTSYKHIDELAEHELRLVCGDKRERVLILVKPWQPLLIDALWRTTSCSLLCTDERILPLREIIECSMKKRRFVSRIVLRGLSTRQQRVSQLHLTPSEKKVLFHLCSGKRGVDIADEFFRSQKTISAHKRNIMKKLGVSTDFALNDIIEEIFGPADHPIFW